MSLHTQQALPENHKFYPGLDGIRAIAVAMVLLVHFFPVQMPYGWMGVQAFFVLSGFLITGILFDTRDDPHRYRNFYARRALRIFPLYYTFLGFLALMILLTHGRGPQHFWLWFVYAQNFHWLVSPAHIDDFVYAGHRGFAAVGHLWSLAIEEQFYFLWPPIVFFVRDRRRLMRLCLAAIAGRILLAIACQLYLPTETLNNGIIYRMLPTQCDGFLMGGWIALWLRGTAALPQLRRAGIWAAVALLGYAACLLILGHWPSLLPGQDIRSYVSGFQTCVGIPIANLVSALVLFAAIQPGSWANRIGNLPALRSLGRVSYGIYVFHLSVYVMLRERISTGFARLHLGMATPAMTFLACCAITVALSYASFYLYEQRFLQLKNRFSATRIGG